MPLYQESGHATPEARAKEAKELVDSLTNATTAMLEHEQNFVTDMTERFEKFGEKTLVSPKQLFWLRDLYERYC